MTSQLALIQKLHNDSPVPYAVISSGFSVLWANACALRRYPALSIPGGLALLLSSTQLEAIKGFVDKQPGAFSIPIAAMQHFAASFTPIEDGFLVSFGFSDLPETSPVLPQSIDYLTTAISGRLRAPLSNIFAGISTIAQMPEAYENGRLRELVQQINLNGYHMLRFTVDFTAYLRFLLGNEPYYPSLLNLCDFLRRFCQAAGMLTEAVNIPLGLDVPDLPIHIQSDDNLLNHALLHIISNCCRFTKPDNAIAITLCADDTRATLTITDNGLGIPQEVLATVCEPFFSYDHSGIPMSGSGLGLAVARQIIALHGGTLAISSLENVGTTVAISLPLARDDCNEALEFKSPSPAADMLRDRFSLLHIILSDSCGIPQP